MAGSIPRVVVITGGSSGIGLSTARLFARHGWSVGLIARSRPALEAAAASLAAPSAIQAVDVTDDAALEAAAGALETALGPIAVWVNCAGNGVYGAFLDIPPAEFARVTAVTYGGTVNGTRAALRRMRPRGRGTVVNVCSAIAFHGLPMLSSYSGAKSAVRGFTDAVRHELIGAGSRIALTTVYPPAVNTPFFSHAPSYMPDVPRPARPVYQPEVVADAILLAAGGRHRDLRVSGVTAVFALACRVTPGLIHHAIQRLGARGQMTRLPEAARRHAPTLHTPSPLPSTAHGPFTAESRTVSTQMWLTRHRRAVRAALATALAAGAIAWLA